MGGGGGGGTAAIVLGSSVSNMRTSPVSHVLLIPARIHGTQVIITILIYGGANREFQAHGWRP